MYMYYIRWFSILIGHSVVRRRYYLPKAIQEECPTTIWKMESY